MTHNRHMELVAIVRFAILVPARRCLKKSGMVNSDWQIMSRLLCLRFAQGCGSLVMTNG